MATHKIAGDAVILALQPGAGRLSDGGGLFLSPFHAGAVHAWRLDYTFHGCRRTITLGQYPQLSLQGARELAAKARADVKAGLDPAVARREERTLARLHGVNARRIAAGLPAIGSFEEVARRWFAVKQDEWMPSYATKVIRRLEMHAFPRFGRLSMQAITPKIVLQACRAVEENDTLETAHRVRELCSNVFRFAISEGCDLRDPCQDIRGALKRPKTTHFAAIIKPAQLGGLLRAIDGYSGSLVVRSALQLAPMLMLRPAELRHALWHEFDLDNGLFYVPSSRLKRTKQEKENGKPHFVPLARQAVAILERLYRQTGHHEMVFPGEWRRTRFMSENTLNAALRTMGYGGDVMTVHGFRATARTLIVEMLQVPEAVVEMQLDHAVRDANGTAYNRTEFVQKRVDMMQAWADLLDELKAGKSSSGYSVLPEFIPVTQRRTAASSPSLPDTNAGPYCA